MCKEMEIMVTVESVAICEENLGEWKDRGIRVDGKFYSIVEQWENRKDKNQPMQGFYIQTSDGRFLNSNLEYV